MLDKTAIADHKLFAIVTAAFVILSAVKDIEATLPPEEFGWMV